MTMLSQHFSLEELTATSHPVDNTPPPECRANLVKLATQILEPIRAKFGPVHISSGFRSVLLNYDIGGALHSAHAYGLAADFHVDNATIEEVCDWIRHASGLEYDQVIDEYSGDKHWCHIGMVTPLHKVPRKQALLYRNGVYSPLP